MKYFYFLTILLLISNNYNEINNQSDKECRSCALSSDSDVCQKDSSLQNAERKESEMVALNQQELNALIASLSPEENELLKKLLLNINEFFANLQNQEQFQKVQEMFKIRDCGLTLILNFVPYKIEKQQTNDSLLLVEA